MQKEILVRVKPGSKKGPLIEDGPDGLVVFVRERAVDGKANDAVVELLARHFGVAKSCITILKGQATRIKKIGIIQ